MCIIWKWVNVKYMRCLKSLMCVMIDDCTYSGYMRRYTTRIMN